MKKKRNINKNTYYGIYICVLLLCFYGLIMIYSASAYSAGISKDCNYDMMFFLKKQAAFIAAGFGIMFILQFCNYRILQKLAGVAYVASTALIVLLIPFGKESNGAVRWLDLPGLPSVQVVELVKIAVIVSLAAFIKKYHGKLKDVAITLGVWLIGGSQALLILIISSDLGSAAVILGITFLLSFVCTKAIKTHIAAFVACIAFVGCYIRYVYNNLPVDSNSLEAYNYRFRRVAAWLAPARYSLGDAYQPLNGVYALGSGGFWGKGLGQSLQKIEYIPEAHTDMILCILGEELGVVGVCVLGILYMMLIYYLVKVVRHSARDLFGSCLVMGVMFHIAVQSLVNIAVVSMTIPNTGITLPFISYGGSSIFCLLIEIAIVMSVERCYIKTCTKKHRSKKRR